MPTSFTPARSGRVVLMAALMSLLSTGAPTSTIAQEETDRKQNPVLALGRFENQGELPVLRETAIDAAIQVMFCLDARDAVNRGQLGRQARQWVLANGHRCRDTHLLFDALGF